MTLRSLISTFIARPFKVAALRKARAAYDAAFAAFADANLRHDTRDMGRLQPALTAALAAKIAAENALFKPEPLARPSARKPAEGRGV
jgi:hypothetical protein